LLSRLVSLCLGAPTEAVGPAVNWVALLPTWAHLAIIAVLGFAMPSAVANWLVAAARAIPGAAL